MCDSNHIWFALMELQTPLVFRQSIFMCCYSSINDIWPINHCTFSYSVCWWTFMVAVRCLFQNIEISLLIACYRCVHMMFQERSVEYIQCTWLTTVTLYWPIRLRRVWKMNCVFSMVGGKYGDSIRLLLARTDTHAAGHVWLSYWGLRLGRG